MDIYRSPFGSSHFCFVRVAVPTNISSMYLSCEDLHCSRSATLYFLVLPPRLARLRRCVARPLALGVLGDVCRIIIAAARVPAKRPRESP